MDNVINLDDSQEDIEEIHPSKTRLGFSNIQGTTLLDDDDDDDESNQSIHELDDLTQTKLKLSSSQMKVLQAIMTKKSVFFTGPAGSGKSYVLKILQDVLNEVGHRKKIAFTAPTGVAACNIGGMTIHAWAGIGIAKDTSEQGIQRMLYQIRRMKEVQERWLTTDILVIDEISMLSDDLFELISLIGIRIRNDPRPFGGIQLILCGDFFQLPPVGLGKSCRFCFESDTWSTVFPMTLSTTYSLSTSSSSSSSSSSCMVLLKKGFRQSNNQFLNLLHELREGYISTINDQLLHKKQYESQQYLNTQKQLQLQQQQQQQLQVKNTTILKNVVTTEINYKHKASVTDKDNTKPTSTTTTISTTTTKVIPTKLYATNKNVDQFNEIEFKKLSNDIYMFEANDIGEDKYLSQFKAGMKAPEKLYLRIGAQVMLLKNLDVAQGLVNGAKGTVVGFKSMLDRDHGNEGDDEDNYGVKIRKKVKSKYSHSYEESGGDSIDNPIYATNSYEPIIEFTVNRGGSNTEKVTVTKVLTIAKWEMNIRDKVVASRSQIPLMLAWAISIHKSQGMTISELEVSLDGIFEYGQAYVALSRAVSLEGLYLLNYNRSKIRAHPDVKTFYQHIKQLNKSTTTTTTSTSSSRHHYDNKNNNEYDHNEEDEECVTVTLNDLIRLYHQQGQDLNLINNIDSNSQHDGNRYPKTERNTGNSKEEEEEEEEKENDTKGWISSKSTPAMNKLNNSKRLATNITTNTNTSFHSFKYQENNDDSNNNNNNNDNNNNSNDNNNNNNNDMMNNSTDSFENLQFIQNDKWKQSYQRVQQLLQKSTHSDNKFHSSNSGNTVGTGNTEYNNHLKRKAHTYVSPMNKPSTCAYYTVMQTLESEKSMNNNNISSSSSSGGDSKNNTYRNTENSSTKNSLKNSNNTTTSISQDKNTSEIQSFASIFNRQISKGDYSTTKSTISSIKSTHAISNSATAIGHVNTQHILDKIQETNKSWYQTQVSTNMSGNTSNSKLYSTNQSPSWNSSQNSNNNNNNNNNKQNGMNVSQSMSSTTTTTTTAGSTVINMQLTETQKRRIEENRQAALKRLEETKKMKFLQEQHS